MEINRVWAMPNKRTFQIPAIRDLIAFYGFSPCIDVFPFGPRRDILADLAVVESNSQKTILFDPPYSPRQAKECYGVELDAVGWTSFIRQVKDECARVLRPPTENTPPFCSAGHIICCGWNSNGLGKSRGFELVEMLVVAHGGSHNDTIVTVERKL